MIGRFVLTVALVLWQLAISVAVLCGLAAVWLAYSRRPAEPSRVYNCEIADQFDRLIEIDGRRVYLTAFCWNPRNPPLITVTLRVHEGESGVPLMYTPKLTDCERMGFVGPCDKIPSVLRRTR